jgi:chemotaxis response regulator CheB
VSVLLLCSSHIGWVGLRSILHEEKQLRVVADACDVAAALDAVQRWKPDAILAGTEVAAGPVVELIE